MPINSFADMAKTLGIENYTPEPSEGRRTKGRGSHKSSDWNPVRLREALSHIPADNQPEWFKVGAALFDASGGSQEGFDLWDEWSQTTRRGNYDPKRQRYMWDRYFKSAGVTAGTIYRMAKRKETKNNQ
ncbi:hypothetical protein EOA33_12440 [Mesorhizobium sp. M4A.F.Ca.ET.050.02.1.1]|nr:hypothetical protein EOA33_12440 [Mesorhizobium sp. M4A.F.Ca.ET.050.02.1.1]RWX68214.1 hypothetical protein EN780_09955 [Mesorhizobium sp. M4B.F.Ca.ET.089.01.1.1]TIT95856.1 MAG: hypothetical protein E5W59_00780 [Mesorhizobium sp.]